MYREKDKSTFYLREKQLCINVCTERKLEIKQKQGGEGSFAICFLSFMLLLTYVVVVHLNLVCAKMCMDVLMTTH